MLAIRLTPDIEARLNRLTQETGRTKTALAREAILEHLDDLEDFYLAEARARQNRITTFGMAHKQGWTYERIGRQVGITGAAVRRLLRRNPEKAA